MQPLAVESWAERNMLLLAGLLLLLIAASYGRPHDFKTVNYY
jgi:hypothetical protein